MDDLLSPTELAAQLKVPVSTVYRWNQEQTGPTPYRIGKHIRYRRADVEAWMEGRAAPDRSEHVQV